MPQSLRHLKTRIISAGNTRKIASVMEIVSLSKLKTMQNLTMNVRKYRLGLESIVDDMLASFRGLEHPLLEKRSDASSILLFVVTSDTGLCGAYNNNVLRVADDFLKSHAGKKMHICCIGKKSSQHFHRIGIRAVHHFSGLHGAYSKEKFDLIAKLMADMFLSRKVDEVHAVFTAFLSPHEQKAMSAKILPITPVDGKAERYLLEPSAAKIMDRLLVIYYTQLVDCVLLNSFVSEHLARVVAMKEAGNNAKELVEELVLARNKMRQADITKEIMEVVSSVDALKG